ncbi:MAG: hypothetical protein HKN16_08275 [Saprospiraceae bacterium]|nr:hypothetical protein [Saprospiraceae bacterium]
MLLFSFLGFLGYKFYHFFGQKDFGAEAIAILALVLIIILFAVSKILRN